VNRSLREDKENTDEKASVSLPVIKKRLSLGGAGNNNSLQHFPELEYKNRFSTIFDEHDNHAGNKPTNFHLPAFSSLKNVPLPPTNNASANCP